MRNQKAVAQDSSIGVSPSMPWRVAKVSPLETYRIAVQFLDGTKGEVDLSQLVMSSDAGVFAVLRDLTLFNQVYIDLGVVTWPGEIDLAPDAMYSEIKRHGSWIAH